MKQEGAQGEAIVRALAQNSASFAGKTAFSQEKWMKKKAKRHLHHLTAARPTALSIVDMYTLKGPEVLGASGVFDEFEFEGEKEDILANMYQFNLACALYGCLLENSTSEQASRMTAMDSATNNANEMMERLRIQYNRQRQAVITTELTEIVAGAESV